MFPGLRKAFIFQLKGAKSIKASIHGKIEADEGYFKESWRHRTAIQRQIDHSA
jgi:hypothetical protein